MTTELNPCNYPFERIPGSFVYDPKALCDNRISVPKDSEIKEAISNQERFASLAYGSNASPQQLDNKFGPDDQKDLIYGVKVILKNYDVVYGAHISQNGYIPATLELSPSTEVNCHILLLTCEQREVLDESEHYVSDGNPKNTYNRKKISSELIECDFNFNEIDTYFLNNGPLYAGGKPVALTAITAPSGRIWPDKTEKELLSFLAKRENLSCDAFVEKLKKPKVDKAAIKEAKKYREKIKKQLKSLPEFLTV